jgi:hypothetical protein
MRKNYSGNNCPGKNCLEKNCSWVGLLLEIIHRKELIINDRILILFGFFDRIRIPLTESIPKPR